MPLSHPTLRYFHSQSTRPCTWKPACVYSSNCITREHRMLPPFLLSRFFLQQHPIVPTATAGVPLPLCQFTSHLHHLSTRTHAQSKASPLLFSPGHNPGTEAISPFPRPLQSAPCHNPPALPCLFVETSLRVRSIFSILPLGGMNLVAWS